MQKILEKGVCTYTDQIHQAPITHEGEDFAIKGKNLHIVHYHMPSISCFNEKIDRYTDFELKRFVEKGKKFSLFKLVTRPCFEFFKFYILKGGIFDKFTGLSLQKWKLITNLSNGQNYMKKNLKINIKI